MTVWVSIEHAKRDGTRYDLWAAQHDEETSRRLMMVHAVYLRRWPDCCWSPQVVRPSGLVMNLPDGWYAPVRQPPYWDGTAADWFRVYPTHFMEIPEGPR